MGSLLCCLRGHGEPEEVVCCFCLPWPFRNNHHSVSGAAARQRGDTRVAPDQGRVPLVPCVATVPVDPMDNFRSPPRPLPYDDPHFSPRREQHTVISGHDNASTQLQKPGQLKESKNTDTGSACTAQKVEDSSVKHHSGGPRIDGIQVRDQLDNEDDCPICLEEYHFENPKIALQCNHNFHLSCIYEWMERSQSCPICAKVCGFYQKLFHLKFRLG
ncbi:hypothetical protein PR202_gb11831 [Eleusine coracana subsp. coracana]|uniref:RING-type E3 ubiquitin transferase n=1 Tax=Eleusine coracana subsp. coracana TaxID=191504 RepID=A0AAV5ENI5_ELECO|nr:hypothetical protein PR202_gb11831 [Eleusine coracana subsp. coracana]